MNSFVDRVRSFASAHELFANGGTYIVALSGGADSVSLLLVMKAISSELGIVVEAAHCNFHLRGEESERDEEFCVELCRRLGTVLHRAHFDTREYATLRHISIEMAARELRYAYFEHLRHDIGALGVCVGHHRDDSVETVLLNLVRGTGLRGLRGIQPISDHIIRPLLCLSRQDILYFLEASGETYVTDSTNLHNDVKRNKIRLDIVPLLQQLNPSVSKSIFETSLRISEAIKVYDDAMRRSVNMVVSTPDGGKPSVAVAVLVDTARLQTLPSPECILFEILSVRGFNTSQINAIALSVSSGSSQSGRVVVSTSHELLFDRQHLIVQPLGWKTHTRAMYIPEAGVYVYSDSVKISICEESVGKGYMPSRDPMCVCVDASIVKFPLVLRPLHDGERFIPFGMKRQRLVSDFLTDHKLTLFDKRRQLVLADADDRIVWIVGLRTDNRFRINADTVRALRIRICLK